MDNRAEKFGQIIIESINGTLDLNTPKNETQIKSISLLFAQYLSILILYVSPNESEINKVSDIVSNNYCGNSLLYHQIMSKFFESYSDDMTEKTLPDIMVLFDNINLEKSVEILRIITNYTECELYKIYGKFEKGKAFNNALIFFKKMSNYLYPEESKNQKTSITPKRKREMKKVAKAITKITNALFEQGVSENGINANIIAFSYAYFIYITAIAEPLSQNDLLVIDETLINYVDKKEPVSASQVLDLMGNYSDALGKRFKEQISNTKSSLEVKTTLKEMFAFACVYFSQNGIQLNIYDIQDYTTKYITRLGKILKVKNSI